jgi:hypothetical protein
MGYILELITLSKVVPLKVQLGGKSLRNHTTLVQPYHIISAHKLHLSPLVISKV